MAGLSIPFGHGSITGYHVLFALSMLLRFGAVPMVKRIQEPSTHPPMPVFSDQVVVVTILWYRRIEGQIRSLRPARTGRKRRPLPEKVTHSAH